MNWNRCKYCGKYVSLKDKGTVIEVSGEAYHKKCLDRYLKKCRDKAKWLKDIDPDKYLDEVRGRDKLNERK